MLSLSGTGTTSPKTWIGGLSVNNDTADSGMFNMGHRNYSPTIGRYLSRDPIGLNGGLNLYSYAGANPVMFVDSRVMCPAGPTITIGRTALTGITTLLMSI